MGCSNDANLNYSFLLLTYFYLCLSKNRLWYITWSFTGNLLYLFVLRGWLLLILILGLLMILLVLAILALALYLSLDNYLLIILADVWGGLVSI